MAENQTASEDSGQQQQQQQQQQQEQQQNNQQSQQQDSSPDQESSSDSITPNPRSKTMHMRTSLTNIKVNRPVTGGSGTGTGTGGNEGTPRQSISSGKHHHHYHHHVHNHSGSGHHGHNVINRTTSESLRLGSEYTAGAGGGLTNSTSNSSSIHGGGSSSLASTTTNSNSTTSNHSHSMSSSSSNSNLSHIHSHHHIHGAGSLHRKPKTSSFQITSVTVGNKLSSDNGDDSADDLDESHTDDNSRVTDLETETPSVSEDTFSKEDVFFANNALSTTAPVIPTSAQYGLVVVDPIGPAVGQTIQNVQVNVADNIINVVSAVGNKKKPEVKETQHRSERFKVVKIESTEPFRRGRWICMDYLDHSGNQALNKEITPEKTTQTSSTASTVTGDDASRGATQTAIILTNDSGASVANATGAGVENHIDATAKLSADGNLNIYRSDSQVAATTGQQNANSPAVHAQTLAGPVNVQQQQQQPQQQQQQFQGQQFEGGHGQTMPHPTDFQQQPQINGSEPSVAGQSQPASFFANQSNTTSVNGVVAGGSTAQTAYQQQQQSTPAHGVTLPTNILMQNGGSGPGSTNGTNFQSVSYIPSSVASSGVEIGAPSTTSIQQSSLPYASQTSTSAAPQSYANSASNIITGGATYTNNSATHQLISDSINPMQGTQQSDSNAATPSGTGTQSQSQSQQPQQPQQQQFQSMHSNPMAGQTMPTPNQMTYDMQAQQQQSAQAATNTPATISDPTVISTTIQQQQIDNTSFSTNNNNGKTGSSSGTPADSNANAGPLPTAVAGGGGGGSGGSGTSSNIPQQPTVPPTSSSLSVTGSVQGSGTSGVNAAPTTSTTGSADDHQLHHNPETETESASSLDYALANRRRLSSIPQLPVLAPIFNFNEPTDPINSNSNNNTNEDGTGTENIFTSLALGDERFKLPLDSTNQYPSDEQLQSLPIESNSDYVITRSQPIPINNPSGMLNRQSSMAYSASPTGSTYPYSPFYYGSPSSPEKYAQPISMSYDSKCSGRRYGFNRLSVPNVMLLSGLGRRRNFTTNGSDRLIRGFDRDAGQRHDGFGTMTSTTTAASSSSATAAALAEGGVASVLNR